MRMQTYLDNNKLNDCLTSIFCILYCINHVHDLGNSDLKAFNAVETTFHNEFL